MNKIGKCNKTQETKKAIERKQERKQNVCGNCGSIHSKGQCVPYGKQCNKCKKRNHYARMFRLSKSIDLCQQQPSKTDDYLFRDS